MSDFTEENCGRAAETLSKFLVSRHFLNLSPDNPDLVADLLKLIKAIDEVHQADTPLASENSSVFLAARLMLKLSVEGFIENRQREKICPAWWDLVGWLRRLKAMIRSS